MHVCVKNFLVVVLVMSTITLCLAKPRWVWLREKNSGENSKDEEATRKIQKDEKNVEKEWKKSAVVEISCKSHPDCTGRKRKINFGEDIKQLSY